MGGFRGEIMGREDEEPENQTALCGQMMLFPISLEFCRPIRSGLLACEPVQQRLRASQVAPVFSSSPLMIPDEWKGWSGSALYIHGQHYGQHYG